MRLLTLLFFLLPGVAVASDRCIQAPDLGATSDAQHALVGIYRDVALALQRFPSLLAALEEKSPEICFATRMDNAFGYLDIERNRIYLSDQIPRAMQVGVLLHEIRHLEQFAHGICPSDELAMKEYARATFALEADASVVSLLVAWDMKEHGSEGPWLALSSWPAQSDIAARFASEMRQSDDAASAASVAFDQWYASQARREDYYVASCSDYLDRQDASKRIPRYQLVPNDFLDDLCTLPDGTRYLCTPPTLTRD